MHTLVGGEVSGFPVKSNYNLRRDNGNLNREIRMPDLKKDGWNQLKKIGSQITYGWHARGGQEKQQWMKFMTAWPGGTKRKEGRKLLHMEGNMKMEWFFPSNEPGRRFGGWSCRTMPAKISMEINDIDVGKTDRAVGSSSSVGLANEDNDRCSRGTNDVIRARNKRGAHGFSRIDGYTQDNSVRHLISYSDQDNGRSSSRCTYCCWGCGGWSEIVMWGVRQQE